jgi:hypothetical protein
MAAHPTWEQLMSENAQEPAGATPTVPTPAEAVAAGQIPAQAQPANSAPPATGQPAAAESEVTDWEAEAAKWKALSRSHEKKHLSALGFSSAAEIDQLRQTAQKYAEFEDAQKSELQKATERATGLEQKLSGLQSANARLMAAATHNIPPDLIDLLGSGTDDEINARAEALAERLKATAPVQAPATQRPVESLTPGAAPASAKESSPDDWIRQMAGRRTT